MNLTQLYPRSLKHLSSELQVLVRGRLWLQVTLAMVLGLVAGVLLGPETGWVSPRLAGLVTSWLALPGQLFLALIQMIVIPLIFASIIRGLAATEDVDQLRKMGLRVVAYFVITTAVAIILGLVLASVIQPGTYVDGDSLRVSLTDSASSAAPDVKGINFADLPSAVVGLIPTNPLTSMVESNTLQVVIFAVVFGVALVMMSPTQSRPLLELMGSLQEVCMTVVRWAMLLAPFAVFGLLVQLTAKLGFDALLGMAVYVGTVLLGLLLLFVMYMIILVVATSQSVLGFFVSVREVILLAFSTSSSAAVMPLSIKVAEEQLGVRPSVSQFVIPMGATINMNGTALYQGIAALFLAQVYGIDISLSGMALIVVTAVGASIGSPATPGVGIVILAMVLSSVGIPASGIALIMGVDRILDMSRTALNVTGDLVAARVMDSWVGGNLNAEQSIKIEAENELIRQETGHDVVIRRESA